MTSAFTRYLLIQHRTKWEAMPRATSGGVSSYTDDVQPDLGEPAGPVDAVRWMQHIT